MAKPIALGHLGLKPSEFYSIGVDDFYHMLKGYEERKRERLLNDAYFTSWIVATHSGKDFYKEIAKPFMKEKVKTEQELMDEKAYYESLYKGGE